MKTIAAYVLLLMVNGAVLAQDKIKLGICDTLPNGFFEKNYTDISIENGAGYCYPHPFKKVLDHRILNFSKLKSLSYMDSPTMKERKDVPLPYEIAQLKTLENLETNVLCDAIFEMTWLKSLVLRVNGKEGPSDLSKKDFSVLSKLENLSISFPYDQSTEFYELKGISKLKNLKAVSLYNGNQRMVNQFLKLKKLESVEITGTPGVAFDFSSTPNIESLSLTRNEMKTIPWTLYTLKKLKYLNLSFNEITELSPGMGKQRHLEMLNLMGNDLLEIPYSLFNCKKMKTLDVSLNKRLSRIPDEIGKMSELEAFGAWECNLQALPNALSNCLQLRSIVADKNQIKDLQLDFSKLSKLEKLSFSENQINHFSNSLFTLPKLRRLNLSWNRISALPKYIGRMEELKDLMLYGNHIRKLPIDIGKLKSLVYLNVGSNRIESLPESITHLEQLQSLSIGSNMLREIPKRIANLTSLYHLKIHNNPLVEFPGEIYDLPNLHSIGVSKEQINLKEFRKEQNYPYVNVIGR